MHQKQLGEKLKARREALGVTQEHLAELSGVALRTLKALETGNANPTLETLNKLTEVLGLDIKISVRTLLP